MPKKAFVTGAKSKSLEYTENDISLISNAFRTHGYDIKISINENKYTMLQDLDKTLKECNFDDTFIFYFSGHGYIGEQGVLHCEYFNNDNFPITDIFTRLENSNPKNKIVILDTCLSGYSSKKWRQRWGERYCLLTSTGQEIGSKAFEFDELESSFMTYHIHKALTSKGHITPKSDKITAFELREYLNEAANLHNSHSEKKVEIPRLYGSVDVEIGMIANTKMPNTNSITTSTQISINQVLAGPHIKLHENLCNKKWKLIDELTSCKSDAERKVIADRITLCNSMIEESENKIKEILK